MSHGGAVGPSRASFAQALAGGIVIATTAPLGAAELAWQGPDSCANRAYVAEQAEALSRRSLDAAEEFRFEVRVEGRGDSWELVLVTEVVENGQHRERRFRGKSCGEVSDAAAVAIAMTLGSQHETAPPPESERPSQEVEPPPTKLPAGLRSSKPTDKVPRDSSGPRTFAGIFAVVDTGALPSVALGADLSLGLEWTQARLALEGGVFVPNSVELSQGHGGSFGPHTERCLHAPPQHSARS